MPKSKKKSTKSKSTPFYRRQWGSNEARYRTRLWHRLQKTVRFEKPRIWWRESRWWQKLLVVLATFLVVSIGTMYGLAQWYTAKHASEPVVLGTTFVPSYARYYGLDPQETFDAIINDLGIRRLRLVSYWNEIEKTPGQYDFSELDWQFRKAEASQSKVSLALGLRQPRWPECHMPEWAEDMPMQEWAPRLKDFMGAVIDRYKDSPALDTYQLENEFFMDVFGECPDFTRERLVDEFNFIKEKDPNHPIIISRSNNAIGIPLGEPRPDVIGISIYKRVWDKNITKRYFEYPFPAWFYGFLAGAQEILVGRNMIIHEMQAEPWMPEGFDMVESSTEEQYKSLNPSRLRDRIKFGKATGMKSVDLWGAEWWYWRKTQQNDPSLWNVVKEEVQNVHNSNLYQ